MNEFQERMLDITKHFIKVVEEHGWEWWVTGGTLLGTIRHKGFIPWDTDIDLYVRREVFDYIAEHPELFEPYKLEPYYRFLKLYDENTTGFAGWWRKGLSIDIFALDEIGQGKICDIGDHTHAVFESKNYEGYELFPFEDIQVRVPHNYEYELS